MSPRDHHPRLDGSELASVLVETLFYGVFFVLFIQCLSTMKERCRTRGESLLKPMSITAAILFTTISSRWFINITLAFDAFIQPTSPGYCVTPTSLNPAERVYLNLPHPKNIMTSALYVTMTIVGDAFMVYRLYIVWGRNKTIIVFPILLCLALSVTGGMVTYLFSQAKTPIFDTAGAWITASFVLTFLCNLYSTSLIALRIHRSNRSLGRAPTDGMLKITEILVESAVLYSVCVILSLGTYVGESNAQFVFVAANGPVIGIIFCMIMSRTHRSFSGGTTTNSTSRRSRVTGTSGSHALRPMAVKITTEIEADIGGTKRPADFGTPPSSPRVYPMRLQKQDSTGEV